MTDEMDLVRRYAEGGRDPNAETLAEARRQLDAAIAAENGEATPLVRQRRTRAIGWVLSAAAVVAVALVLAASSLTRPSPAPRAHAAPGTNVRARLVQLVVDDVNVTVASGNYDMTFSRVTTPPANCAQDLNGSTIQSLSSPSPCHPPLGNVSGHGTVDTDPYDMVTVSQDGPLGIITVFDDGTDIWEFGGGDYGLTGPDQAGPGSPLSGFAASVEGTLGQEAGALAMQGLASGSGYLDLESQEIQGAAPAGTGTVDGVPVTIYKLSMTGLQDPDMSTLTSEQVQTIRQADAILRSSGFGGETTWVSVDADGYIREQRTLYTLSDGTIVMNDTVLSNFGCAGSVRAPGQPGASEPVPGCQSPDKATTGAAPPESTEPSTTSGPPTTGSPTTGPPTTSSPPNSTSSPSTMVPSTVPPTTLPPTTTSLPPATGPPPATPTPG